MEDEQKLKLLRLAINYASDFDEAKANVSFILGDRSPLTTCTTRTDNSNLAKNYGRLPADWGGTLGTDSASV
jgi:hypothetical protein